MSIKYFIFTVILLVSLNLPASYGKKPVPLEILFVANTNALLENCHCGNPSLGGLARIATIIKEERKRNPHLIFIDGGDFFNTYPFKEINETVLDIYSSIMPDIIIPGENEFIDGIPLIKPFLKINAHKTICSNFRIADIKTKDYFKKNSLIFVSYLDKSLFLNDISGGLIFDEDLFKKEYDKFKENFLVVIYHGYSDSIESFIKKYPEIDLILAAHTDVGFVNSTSNVQIIGSGTDGEYIVKITLGENHVAKVELLEVKLAVKQDEDVLKYISKFKIEERKRRALEK
jgi:2',3'-cyclic-nucleotide 2'-phosphodiesterase (5'-nucleotidase family)